MGTNKHSSPRIDAEGSMKWDEAVPNVTYGYCQLKMREGYSPFDLLYETPPRMHSRGSVSLFGMSTPLHCQVELMTTQYTRAERVVLQTIREDSKRHFHRCQVGDQVLFIRIRAFNVNVK